VFKAVEEGKNLPEDEEVKIGNQNLLAKQTRAKSTTNSDNKKQKKKIRHSFTAGEKINIPNDGSSDELGEIQDKNPSTAKKVNNTTPQNSTDTIEKIGNASILPDQENLVTTENNPAPNLSRDSDQNCQVI
jgi:hypothetical protein